MKDEVINHIEKTYGIKGKHPWARYPENITFKEKYTDKWFALILPVRGINIGIDTDDVIDILNVKADEDFIGMCAGVRGYMRAYHMNKDHWLSVLLDGSVPFHEVCDRIADSYDIVSDSPTKRIYEAVKRIPKGCVATYGQVAAMAGNPKMARAVGNALHKNPDENDIPCYRVVNSKGMLADEFVFGGADVQKIRLEADGIEVKDGRVDLERFGMR